MSVVLDELTYAGYATGWAAVRRLGERQAYALFARLADSAWRRRGKGVVRLEANLSRILPPDADLRAASRQGMRSYFRYWCDSFRIPDWSPERVVGRVRTIGEENLRDTLAAGRGVAASLPHMGNWDHAGAWAALTDAPVTTVAERLKPERLFERFLAFRESLGMEIIPLTGGVDPFDTLRERLRGPRLVPLLGDRDLTRSGVAVTLAGETATMPPGPAALAVRTGAALVPVTLWYEGTEPDHSLVVRFHPEVPAPDTARFRDKVTVMTQAVADVFTAGFREHPHDWHMLQKVFAADLDPARAPAAP